MVRLIESDGKIRALVEDPFIYDFMVTLDRNFSIVNDGDSDESSCWFIVEPEAVGSSATGADIQSFADRYFQGSEYCCNVREVEDMPGDYLVDISLYV